MERAELSVKQIEEKAKNELQSIAKAGNTRQTASFVQSIAETLNTKDDSKSKSEKSPKDNEKKKEVNNTLTLTPAPLPSFPSPPPPPSLSQSPS